MPSLHRNLPSAHLTSGRVEIGEGSKHFRHPVHQDNRTGSPSCRSAYLGTHQRFVILPVAHRFQRASSRKRASYIKGSTPGGAPSETSASIPTPRSQVTLTSNNLWGHYVSVETGSPVERTQENYMFRLTSFRDQLLVHIKSNPDFIYPPARYQEVLDFFESYTQEDLSISRPKNRLSWGIPVPNDPTHTCTSGLRR